VLLEVTGSDWRESEKADNLFAGDSAEFYLAAHPGSADRCQWVVAPGMDGRFPEPRHALADFATSPWLRQNSPAVSVARRKTLSGYRLETLLPWAALKLTPATGAEAAFHAMVSNHDRAGRPAAHLLWFPTLGAAFDSRRMHRIRLAEQAAPPVTARAVVRVNHRDSSTTCEVLAPARADGSEARLRSAAGVLAAGTLKADAGSNGFARVTLTGPGTDADVVFLDVDGKQADVVPLALPRPEMTIETRVRIESSGPGLSVVLRLPDAPPPAYRVSRRRQGEKWQVAAESAPPGEFRDGPLEKGTLYEYEVARDGNGPAAGYFWTGSEVPLRDRRGTVLLLVEQSMAAPLAAEIRRLVLDLAGDGWQVIRRDVAATQAVVEVKGIILAEHQRAPADLSTVFLLGRVPVPYAGHARPDGHGPGAWPADACYGDLEGKWTDERTNGRRGGEAAPDGKFDQSVIPGLVKLAVGRVDFSGMTVFGAGETTLLRRYLDRDHAYRHAELAVAARGFVHDGFPGHAERFAADGWQNFTTLVGPENVRTVTWPNVKPGTSLFFYACGPGHPDNVQGFGAIRDLAAMPMDAVFTLFFGSCIGEWSAPDNMMRATLAHERGALTSGWGGRPHWYLHSLGMGETIGDCLRRTQNNDGADYRPAGSYARGTHIALLGDPTLRMHRVAPPSDVKARALPRGVRLTWAAAPGRVAGYHVYRADSESGPCERITPRLVTGLMHDDPAGTAGHFYQVRSIVLQESTTGSYFNNSQGAFASMKD